MTLSGDSEQNRYLQDLVGFEGENLDIAVDPASSVRESDNTGNISLADFHSAPKFNKLILGGVIALSCTILGFFFFNRSPVNSETSVSNSNEKPTETEPPILEKSSQDSRVGQLKTEVALSKQQQAMKEQNIEPPSTRSPRSLTQDQSPRSTSAPLSTERRAQTVSRSVPPAPPSYVPPPRVPFRPVERRVVGYVPPPFSIRRRMPTMVAMSSRGVGATSARPLSYQFGVPRSAKNESSNLEASSQPPAEIPPNYQVYYPNRGTDASGTDADGMDVDSPTVHQNAGSASAAKPSAKLVNVTSPVAISPAEQRFLQGRPMMRSISVGTQIFAQIFQATAVDNAQRGDKVLLRVSQPLADAHGKQLIAKGTLIGATVQIGDGGVARVTPEVIYLNDRPFPLPANSLIVALQDGNPLVAERIERGGGDRGGFNPLGLLVDTGTTFMPFLSSGNNNGDSNGFSEFYKYQRLNDYANRNFGGNQRAGNYAQQVSQPAVYFKLPPNLDVQMLVVAPFELPL